MIRVAGGLLIGLAIGFLVFRSWLGGLLGFDAQIVALAGIGLLVLVVGLFLGSLAHRQGPASRWLFRWRLARATALAVIVILTLMAIVVYVHTPPQVDRSELISLVFVAVFSGGVGFGELTERYRDDPARLFSADPTIIYVCVNVAAAVGALALIKEFEVFDAARPHHEIYEVLLASFGSIAFFRSSLFTARVGDKDVDVGPSTLLKSLLETSDRMINRSQARDRADDAASIMQRVDFGLAKAALPAFCFTVVENVTMEDQERIGTVINQLSSAAMSDRQRSIILGTYLMRVVGPMVLERAVNALGDTITVVPPAPPP